MIRFVAPAGRSATPWNRREFLRVGGWAGLVALAGRGGRNVRAEAGQSLDFPGFGRAKSVIFVYANGGQSQFETWDPKPDAPLEVRGAFDSIPTAIPGVRFTEYLPMVAKVADRFTILRSVSHDDLDHGSAAYLTLTGHYHPRKSSNPLPSPDDFPTLGALLKRVKVPSRSPHAAVHINGPVLVPELPAPGQDGGFLGREYEPLVVGDPTAGIEGMPNLSLPDDLPPVRLEARRSLLEAVESYRHDVFNDPDILEKNALYRQAYEILSDPSSREAFDLSQEPSALRDRYGRNRSGQSCLLARRLVEAGVPFITVVWNHSARGQDNRPDAIDFHGWDTHNDIFDVMRDALLPRFDQSFSALLEDLDARGLLDETLVVCAGEFGRAPKVALEPRFAGASPGRKHWANVYSIVLAGAGVARGSVVGSSDRLGAYPTSERVGPWDVAATMFSSLGINPHREYRDALDRPFPLCTGKPIEGVYG